MEFEDKSVDQSPEISDATRLQASAKHINLEPLHADVTPDDTSEDNVAIAPAPGEPLATIESESENTASYAVAAAASPLKQVLPRRSIYIIAGAAFVTLAGGIIAFLQLI